MTGRTMLTWMMTALGLAGTAGTNALAAGEAPGRPTLERVVKTEEEWKRLLTPEQFRVLRQKGTEMAFTGRYHNFKGQGIYRCAACGLELFGSDKKFESGTGWPSFWAPFARANVGEISDSTLGMIRIEVVCNRCGGHLGHVFDDGPAPTHLRYCINSASLKFVASGKPAVAPKKGR